MSHHPIGSIRPLVVDLDGTVLRTDLLVESASQFALRRPWRTPAMLRWLAEGRAILKEQLAANTMLDLETMPIRDDVVRWITEERANGRTVVLATASHKRLAAPLADRLGLFDEVIATDGDTNLKSTAKRDALVARYGHRGFDYAGDSTADLAVWGAAANAYVVSDSASLIARVQRLTNLAGQFPAGTQSQIFAAIQAMRPHQWVKNVLIAVPLLSAHLISDAQRLIAVALAFVVFGMIASSVYVLNDLVDVQDDRRHPRKRLRPVASGALSMPLAWALWPALLFGGFSLAALTLPPLFLASLGAYFALTVAYSLSFKQSAIVDVITLAALYTLRIVAGAAAISIALSFWLLAFSMFLFLSLACIKRFSELKAALDSGRADRIPGRGYFPSDLNIIAVLGGSAGCIAVLVLALYIQDSHTAELYSRPEAIWLVCPLLLYWISRAWLFAHRGWMHDDPIVFALKDKMSWAIGALVATAFVLAKIL
jgi:4-hydroxybenzoate polyprenyltransferase/phosphoserine phosphatase